MDLAQPLPGSDFEGFRVLDKIHEGSMAVLYRVAKEGLDLPLVMKLPKLGFGSHPACYTGFEVEQMVLATLKGPHVPRLIARGDLAVAPYLVMEWIEGTPLAEFAARAPLPAQEVAALMARVAIAVDDLHRQDVIHFDLKPQNVILRPSGEAVILDFGLARHRHLPDLADEQAADALGTAAYISPEQVRGNRSDARSDVFALGVIAYELATGTLPFGTPRSARALRRRLYLEPRPPRRLRPELPPWLQEIVLRCLEPDAAQRYASAAQLAHDLAHPQQVPISSRGERTSRSGPTMLAKRWLGALYDAGRAPEEEMREPAAPHLLVAVDCEHADERLAQAMREAVGRALATTPDCRVTFLSVREPAGFADEGSAEIDRGRHTQCLIQLRHWATALALSADKIRHHVVEGSDTATAILDYAAAHHIDHIIMGARGHSAMRRFLGSVSARVVAEAGCTVTVVREAGGG